MQALKICGFFIKSFLPIRKDKPTAALKQTGYNGLVEKTINNV